MNFFIKKANLYGTKKIENRTTHCSPHEEVEGCGKIFDLFSITLHVDFESVTEISFKAKIQKHYQASLLDNFARKIESLYGLYGF